MSEKEQDQNPQPEEEHPQVEPDGADATPEASPAEPAEPAEPHVLQPGDLPGDIPGAEWGEIDAEGQVWVKPMAGMPARMIGKAKGRDPKLAFGFFVERFQKLEALTTALEQQVQKAENKGRFSERVARLLERVRTAQALGDFEALLRRLEALRDLVHFFQAEMRSRKERLCEQAEALKDSTEWKETTERLKALQHEWKGLGSSSRGDDERLWTRFRAALDHFFEQRDKDRADRRQQQQEARTKKAALCEEAESLADSTDWAATARRQDEMMEEWKATGWAGKAEENRLWERFRAARGKFFDARRDAQKGFRKELDENRKRKDALCEAAEALLQVDNALDACEQAKALQAEWKQVGPSPRAVSKEQWDRFRGTLDKVFERGRGEHKQVKQRRRQVHQEGFERKREKAEKLRESIARDVGHIERWRKAISTLGDGAGGLLSELEEKVGAVEQQLEEKRQSLEALEQEIRRETRESADG